MPDDKTTPDAPVDHGRNTGYSADYVRELRDEAASWRTKLRDSETKYQTLEKSVQEATVKATLGEELSKRGVKVNPEWIKIGQGQTTAQAVDLFLKEYPQFAAGNTDDGDVITAQAADTTPDPRSQQRPQTTKKANSNVQVGKVSDLQAIKKDPVARAKVRDLYRSLVANQSRSNFGV